MRRTLFGCMVLGWLFVLSTCKKKETIAPSLPLDFSKHYSIENAYDKKEHLLVVTIKLDKNLHAYGAQEKTAKPVRLEILPTNGWSADGPADIPKGVIKNLAGLGQSNVIEGSFQIRQKVKPGNGLGAARLLLQVCTNNACDQPRIHKLVIE